MVTLLIFGILASTAITNVNQIQNPLQDSASASLGFLKQVRARALETTSAYTVAPASAVSVAVSYSARCDSATTTPDPGLRLDLNDGVSLTDTTWSVCFDARGLATGAQSFSMQGDGRQATIEIFLGGAVRQG